MKPLSRLRDTVSLDASEPALFLSDLHFGDGTAVDQFAGRDGELIAFLERERQGMSAIVFLGDILDMPQAWRWRRIRAAHPELWSYLTRLVRTTRVIFTRGNHDWYVDYEKLFPGATRCEAILLGERVLAWHGHQVDLVMNPGAGNAVVKTYVHAFLERVVGRRLLPPLDRYDSPANRVAMAVLNGWGHVSVARARALRGMGRTGSAAAIDAHVRYLARSVNGDPADIFGATQRLVLGHGFDAVLCGHTHVPGVVGTPRGVYANTGTWADGLQTFARWTGDRFLVQDALSGRKLGDEEFSNVPTETEPKDLFRWWVTHHKGFLRFEL